ncbi:MAG TPA: serine hydrolase domain-containing protein, partial [Candidatus Eisenbacteria bacterium]|nr:serine hydrolase domain-containing protein [Candidatus Eisenbacteria bacterium]
MTNLKPLQSHQSSRSSFELRHNSIRKFQSREISAKILKNRRFSNPDGIVSFSPGLLARWDKFVDRIGVAKPKYPAGRGTSYPGLLPRRSSTPAGLRQISVAKPQPRWGSWLLAQISQGSSFFATLGFLPESLWDSSLGFPKCIRLRHSFVIRHSSFVIFSALFALQLALGLLCAAEPLDRDVLDKMDAEITHAIAEGKLPGAVLWVEHDDSHYTKAFGERALVPQSETMTKDTIFDVASLTKVLATAPSVMLLLERGKLKLDERVQTYLPEFKGHGKDAITLRHLLTHTSGLRAGLGASPPWSGYEKAIELACAEIVTNAPGTFFRYSDINFIVLGEVVRRVSGSKLDEFAAREIFQPLKMTDTGFLPPASMLGRIAPTEKAGAEILRGKVHDPTARRMGGVAGHAGLFSTAADLARFAHMMLHRGELEGTRILKPETVKLMTSVQSPEAVPARRGLGWDIDSAYSRPRGEVFPLGSFGHTGFTGACFWIDPFSETFVIFLSNRVHPDGKGNVLPLYGKLGTLAAEAVTDFDFAFVPGALAVSSPTAP